LRLHSNLDGVLQILTALKRPFAQASGLFCYVGANYKLPTVVGTQVVYSEMKLPASLYCRRGAQMRVLLDSLFDDADALRPNRATVDYLHALAANEGLDMGARTGNPTGGGIHRKLLLVKVGWAFSLR
jgi:hypothetical protein